MVENMLSKTSFATNESPPKKRVTTKISAYYQEQFLS